MGLAAEFGLPKSIGVEPSGIYAGRGEDDPILSQRLLRDGWKLRQAPEGWENKPKSRIWHEFTKKEIWAKSSGAWTVEMLVAGIHERDGLWYVLEHRVLDALGRVTLDLGRSDWADFGRSPRGQVLNR
jgi:hypothetical protein